MQTSLIAPRARLAAAVLVATLSIAPLARVSAQIKPPAGAQSAPAPQAAAAQVPVREVVLFTSGVGYFEHFGTVNGNATTELSFKKEQINDILKSLLLEDLDKGKVTSVTYGSQGPLAHTLKSFEVDITANPPLSDLLNQLRGARISVSTQGAQSSGTVLGVEKRQRQTPGGDKGAVVDFWVLNLVTDAGAIRPVELDQVQEVKLEDPKLQQELAKALVALSLARDQDKKPVSVHFVGQGQRRVRIGYVVETPVWKTSYRLVLPPAADDAGKGAGEKPGPAETVPATRPAGGAAAGAGAAKPGAEGKLQGWAIVENQTDNDWTDVQLSLVSGRPISFIENLYQPLYVPRPLVQPQLFASLRPQTYEGGLGAPARDVDRFAGEKQDMQRKAANNRRERAAKDGPAAAAVPGAFGGAALADADDEADKRSEAKGAAMDPMASVSSIASASKVGELFQYTVGSVSLPRQQSAMIPIVTDQVDVRRLSIFNASVLPRNPLLGARLTNDTGKHLPQGPLTVLDGGSYAGDATIEDLPVNQSRLISYGVDQQVLVNATAVQQDSRLLTGRILKGVLELSYKRIFTQDYVSENKADHAKQLLIEHPLHPGWKLVQPEKAAETTNVLYRFEGAVAAGHTSKLTVQEELVDAQRFQILPMDVGQVELYSRTGEIPAAVRDALIGAAKLKRTLEDTSRQIQEKQQKIGEISTEQNRIRDNMKTVAASSEYYQRLLKKLDEQETSIEKLQGEVKDLQTKLQAQQKELENYLSNMDVSSDAPKAK